MRLPDGVEEWLRGLGAEVKTKGSCVWYWPLAVPNGIEWWRGERALAIAFRPDQALSLYYVDVATKNEGMQWFHREMLVTRMDVHARGWDACLGEHRSFIVDWFL